MINEKLLDLYTKYYDGDPKGEMVRCGVVDEDIYLASQPKLVFVLKEPHSSHNNFQSLVV